MERIWYAETNIDEGNWLEMKATCGKENGSISMPLAMLPKALQRKAKSRPVQIAITISEVKPKEVEYWIEPIPGSGATIPAFKAQTKAHGLHWLNHTSKQFRGHYQMRPRPVTQS